MLCTQMKLSKTNHNKYKIIDIKIQFDLYVIMSLYLFAHTCMHIHVCGDSMGSYEMSFSITLDFVF